MGRNGIQSNGPDAARMSRLGRCLGFFLFTTAGLAALAAVLLAPEWAALARLESQRDALAHQLDCEGKLSEYYDNYIRAIRTDPNVTTRLLIRHGNYRPLGCRPAEPGLPNDSPAVPQQLLLLARTAPPQEHEALMRADLFLQDRFTHGSLIALSLASIAAGVVLFVSPQPSGPRRSPAPPPTA